RAGRTGDVKHVRAVQTLHSGATGKVARRRGIGRKRGLARLLRECISDPFIRFRFRATPMTPSLRALRALALPLAALLLVPTAAAQWTTQSPVPTHLDIRGIAAPTAQRIFVGTEDDSFDDGGALFESQDGGATWVQRDVPASLGSPLNGLFFLDAQRGWAFGNENARTTDGGTTWQAIPALGSTYFMRFYTPD